MNRIRVLVAEDSPTSRAAIRMMLASEPDLEVIAEATNGADAVELTKLHRPDVVLMDVHMPVLDGIEATRAIMEQAPTPIVVVSAVTEDDVDLSLTATQAGALIALQKPDGPSSARFPQQREELVSMLRAMAQVKVVRHWSEETSTDAHSRSAGLRNHPEVIAMAASTGGPAALREIIRSLPRDFHVPIVIVQHITRDFTPGFTRWLGQGSPLPVRLAEHHQPLEPGTVHVAPDDAHTGVRRDRRVHLSKSPAIGGFRPSANFLFDSVARAFGSAAIGVILTGMGNDGVNGLLKLREAGGYVIGQDERSSIVFGMAAEAWRCAAIDELLPLDRIPERLIQLTDRRAG